MTDWLANISVYDDYHQATNAMNNAVELDKHEYEMCERDRVLAGVVCYLVKYYTPDILQEHILQIVDTYCGKPIDWKEE